jgi:ribosomal protein S18 acetylase RimI-like enzyme
MEILQATDKDIPVIQHIACLTWPHAYAEIISPRQVSYMLDKMYHASTLLSQMNKEEHLFFLCYENSQPIGFAGISKVDYFLNGNVINNTWKLHKLYVLPEVQKSGGGKKLLDSCFETIKENKGEMIILNVNRQNPAYHFYLKKGFEVLEEVDLDIGAGFFMVDYIMGKKMSDQ